MFQMRTASAADLEERLSLKPLRVEIWAGMVWVCMDDEAPSLREYLGPVIEMVEPFRPHDMRLVEDQTCLLDQL